VNKKQGTISETTSAITAHIIAHIKDVPVNSSRAFTIPSSNRSALLIHLPGDKFVAFEATCTHKGCKVAYDSKSHTIQCPCHNAAFSPTQHGKVLSGPPPKALPEVPLTVNKKQGTITVS
jgi:Rieske Fe-S protein